MMALASTSLPESRAQGPGSRTPCLSFARLDAYFLDYAC